MFTPENITSLAPNEIFVFGSNLAGRHGAGAAGTALRLFGAHWGQGVGFSEQSYAIPTKNHHIQILPLQFIRPYVAEFLEFAASRLDLRFFVTPIGCGLAGYTPKDIAPLFLEGSYAPTSNIVFPRSFYP
jgi:hypothetical protein